MRRGDITRRLAALVLPAVLAGCGYHQTNEYEATPEQVQGPRADVRTVAIPTFANETKAAGIEQSVTQAVRDAFATQTPYKIRDRQAADTAIEGRITDVEFDKDKPDQIRKINAKFRWRELWVDKDLLAWRDVDAADAKSLAQEIMAHISGPQATTRPGQGGYAWHSLYREDVSTVAVPIFTNKSFSRGIEFQLSKAIANYMESSTPYKVVSREKADTILEGEIVSVSGDMISANRDTTLPQEQMITIRVNFLWKDLRTGKVLVRRQGFEQSTMYYPTLGEGAYIGQQSGAERLAIGIVQELQADW